MISLMYVDAITVVYEYVIYGVRLMTSAMRTLFLTIGSLYMIYGPCDPRVESIQILKNR